MIRREIDGWVGVLVLLATGGCAWASALAAADVPREPAVVRSAAGFEPAGVKVERIIATQRDLGGGKLLRMLTGRSNAGLFQRPFAAAWDGDDLLVTDPGRAQILRLGARKRLLQSAPGLFASPIGIASCADGIVVTDSRLGKVALLDSELKLRSWLVEGVDRPTGVTCEGDRLFIVETGRHRVLVLEPADVARSGAETVRFFIPQADDAPVVLDPDRALRVLGRRGPGVGEFNFPTLIASGHGALWVGDTMNHRIQVFELGSGKPTASFGRLGDAPGEMPRLKGMTFDSGGRLWVTDAYLEQIAIYDPRGLFLIALGGPGAAPGDFALPAGLAAHADGRMAIVDSLNRRVQIFRLLDDRSRR